MPIPTASDEPWALSPSVALRPEPFGALAYHFGNRKLTFLKRPELVAVVRGLGRPARRARSALVAAGVPPTQHAGVRRRAARPRRHRHDPTPGGRMTATVERPTTGSLVEQFELGLDAPICLTWELTYACNLECAHCLSSSGRRDPRELTTEQCEAVIDELQRMQVFYVNIGGGEPTIRPDFWHLLRVRRRPPGRREVLHQRRPDHPRARARSWPARLRRYVDVQISLDGATAEVNDYVRGPGSYDMALTALQNLQDAGFRDAKISVVCTRQNIGQLDEFKALADQYGATLRLTRLRPSGRGADVWDELHPLPEQQRVLYDWLMAHGDDVLTGDSFFHLAAFGESLPGLNLCGAGRVVCLIDPVGDVYACPFAIHDNFLAGNLLADGGFQQVWQDSELFAELRSPQTGGACATCALLRLLPRRLHGGQVLHRPAARRPGPRVRAGVRRDRPRRRPRRPGREPGPLQGQPDPQPAGDAQAADPAAGQRLRGEPAGRVRPRSAGGRCS